MAQRFDPFVISKDARARREPSLTKVISFAAPTESTYQEIQVVHGHERSRLLRSGRR